MSILLTKGSKEIKAIYKSIEGERLVLERYRAFVERTKRAYSRDAKKKLKKRAELRLRKHAAKLGFQVIPAANL